MKCAGCLLFVVLAWQTISSLAAAEPREWKSADGRTTVKAELIDVAEGQVKLRKENGKEITVPMEKRSAEDQDLARKPAGKKSSSDRPPDATMELKWDGGSVKLPARSVFEMRAITNHKVRGVNVHVEGVPAIAVAVEGSDRPVVITAVSHFSQGPIPIPADRVGQDLSKITVHDAVTGQLIGPCDQVLPLTSRERTVSDASDDLFAIRAPKSGKIGALKLAQAAKDDNCFLLQTSDKDRGQQRRRSLRLVPIKVTGLKEKALYFKFTDTKEKYPILGGAPLLNTQGQVVGIYVGVAEGPNSEMGLANPGLVIQQKLNAAR